MGPGKVLSSASASASKQQPRSQARRGASTTTSSSAIADGGAGGREGSQLPHSPSSTAAARFYRQNRRRTLSDTSVDSQPGFIDHRGSQASMPSPSLPRRTINISDSHARHQHASSSLSSQQHRQRQPSSPTRGTPARSAVAARGRGSRLRSEVKAVPATGNSNKRGTALSSEDDNDPLAVQGSDEVDHTGGTRRRLEEDMRQSAATITGPRPRRGTYESTLSASRPDVSPIRDNQNQEHQSRQRSEYDMPDAEFDEAALRGSALIGDEEEEDEPGVVDHRGHQHRQQYRQRSSSPQERPAVFLQRTSSRGSRHSNHSSRQAGLDRPVRRGDGEGEEDDDTFTPSLSRRTSDIGKVEEDVCYPMLQMREAEMHEERQAEHGTSHHSHEAEGDRPRRCRRSSHEDDRRHGRASPGRHDHERHHHEDDETQGSRHSHLHHRASDSRMGYAARDSLGIPGVLPNFPFPFDFGSLEEYCEEEREKHGIAIPRAKKGIPSGASTDATAVASGSAGSTSGQRAISFSPDNPIGGMMRRRMMNGGADGSAPTSRRQRKLSQSVSGHVGRYQRKLALFEGSSSSAGQRNDDKATGADVKTPLLSDGGGAGPGRTGGAGGKAGFGATAFASHRGGNSASEKARPYRFSFYSNALPSTIHARSLAEIPAEGQTFEELFVGRQESPAPDEWEGKRSSSGHATPNNGQGENGQPTSVNSYKTVGALGGMMSRAPNYDQKPRNNLIRSVEDAEANTWWLDVLCPTDAEMKVLGKVRRATNPLLLSSN